jgi:dienelactone hydrolase
LPTAKHVVATWVVAICATSGAVSSLSSCVTMRRDTPAGWSAPAGFESVAARYRRSAPSLDPWLKAGPIPWDMRVNVVLALDGGEAVIADELTPRAPGRAPLVVLVHGNHSRKEAHRAQAERLASWGFRAIAVQLPAARQWPENGRTLAKLATALARGTAGSRGAPTAPILVGHSFGGSAVTIAAGLGAPTLGQILLDPAWVSDKVRRPARAVRTPSLVLGADKSVFRSRRRPRFFAELDAGRAPEVAEVSVKGATHDDAQNPSMFSLSAFGFDPYTSAEQRDVFTAAIVAGAFSIATSGKLDWVWRALRAEAAQGTVKDLKRSQGAGRGSRR